MGSSAIAYLNDTEEEVIRLLVEIGMKAHEARLLAVFFRGIEPTSRDLERITNLRQPEVSIAITSLSKRKWVCVSSLINANKGRPVKIFKLAGAIDDILDEMKGGIVSGHNQQILLLTKIREILHR